MTPSSDDIRAAVTDAMPYPSQLHAIVGTAVESWLDDNRPAINRAIARAVDRAVTAHLKETNTP